MSHPDLANSEKSATLHVPLGGASSSAPSRKIRSCFVCRQRKVRCDKQFPCGNCQRAKIPCVLPAADRPPRWARRRELLANNALAASQAVEPRDADLMERVRYLENLVAELSDQLQHAHTETRRGYGTSALPTPGSSTQAQDRLYEPAAEADDMRKQFGRMIIQDSGRTRYVTGFWSQLDDEVDGLDIDTDGSLDEGSDNPETETSPGDSSVAKDHDPNTHHYGFLFPRSSGPNVRDFRPLPSQIPFLLEVFSENVYPLLCIVHMPSIKKKVHDMRNTEAKDLSASDDALLYSLYYAAIVSMEEDETMTNFGEPKADLSLKYRRGLEDALSRADFLNLPDLTLLQALVIFIFLARRHDSPRYVWFMTALVTRMAHYLGLHRDGAQFKHLTPYEVELRRRVWCVVVMLDIRASEDQGTEITIKQGGFDTSLPLNINVADIDPEAKDAPTQQVGVTEVSFLRAAGSNANITLRIMAAKSGDALNSYEERNKLLDEVYADYEREYLRHVPSAGNSLYWVAATAARIVLGKLTLLVYLPVLLSSPGERGSESLRNRLLASAIDVAEFNHALNEQAQRWRWIWQVQTHWYAFVYLLLETSRRPWSPVVERAWVALHSKWLFPQQSPTHRNMRIWIPLRKLIHKARAHREAELHRLRHDPQAAAVLELEDQQIPTPSSPGLDIDESSEDLCRQQWRDLVAPIGNIEKAPSFDAILTTMSANSNKKRSGAGDMTESAASNTTGSIHPYNVNTYIASGESGSATYASNSVDAGQPFVKPSDNPASIGAEHASDRGAWPDFTNWLWADNDTSLDMFSTLDMDLDFLDPNIDLDVDTNWYDWIESAKAMQ